MTYGTFFSKYKFFIRRLQLFYCLVLTQSIQFFNWQFESARFFLQMKHFFFSLQPLPWKVRNCLFFLSLWNIETNFFNTIRQIINPNYAWKNCCNDGSSTPLLITQIMGSKCGNFFFNFWYHLSYTWVDFICLTCPTFPKSLWWTAWAFWAWELLEKTILSIICLS